MHMYMAWPEETDLQSYNYKFSLTSFPSDIAHQDSPKKRVMYAINLSTSSSVIALYSETRMPRTIMSDIER